MIGAAPAAAVVVGLGAVLPPRAVPNAEFVTDLDVTEEWIERRTGIRSRRAVEPGVLTSDLAVTAGRNALKSAGMEDVDAVIVASTTPDRLSPAMAPDVAYRLGIGHSVAAFDTVTSYAPFSVVVFPCAPTGLPL